jgi:rod shape-determining protein MreD
MKIKKNRPVYRRIALVLMIGLTAALQYNAVHYVKAGGALPNLMLVAAVTAGFTLGSEAGGFAGLCLGLYNDAQSGKILGLHALTLLYAGVVAGLAPKKPGVGELPAALIAVYAATVLYEFSIYLFAYALPVLRNGFVPGADLLRAVGTVIIPAAFINTLLGIPYFYILRPGARVDA